MKSLTTTFPLVYPKLRLFHRIFSRVAVRGHRLRLRCNDKGLCSLSKVGSMGRDGSSKLLQRTELCRVISVQGTEPRLTLWRSSLLISRVLRACNSVRSFSCNDHLSLIIRILLRSCAGHWRIFLSFQIWNFNHYRQLRWCGSNY